MLPRILAKGRSLMLVGLVVIGLASAAAGIGVAYAVAGLFTAALGGEPPIEIRLLFALLPVAALILLTLQVGQRALAEHLGQHYVVELRSVIFDRLYALADRERARLRQGHLMTRFTADLTAIRAWVAQGLAAAMTGAATLAGLLIFLAFIEPVFGLVVAAGALVLVAAVLLIGPVLRQRIWWARRKRARLSAFMGERVTAMSSVRALGAGARDRRRLLDLSRRLAAAMVRRAAWTESARALPGAGGLLVPALCLAVVPWVMADGVTPQTLVLVMTVAGLATQPLTQLTQAYVHRTNFGVARNMLRVLFELPVQPTRGGNGNGRGLPDKPAAIEIRDLAVADGSAQFSASADAGSRIVIDGAAGSGKSRLLRMLAGFERVPRRKVRFKSRDLAKVWRESLHREVRLFMPEMPLLQGSLRRNLGLNANTTLDLPALLNECGISPKLIPQDEIESFRIREAGANVASSLHMRILLARALAGNPQVLLIDDFDRIQDTCVRQQICELWQSASDTTVLIVSDSDDIRERADQIWHINQIDHISEAHSVPRFSQENVHEAA